MSLPIDISFRPAYHALKDSKRKDDIRLARKRAVREAWFKLWGEFEHQLAKRTGRFRQAVKGMIESQLPKLVHNKLTIRFLDLSGPIWAKYHIFGPEGEALDTRKYRHPFTPNTRPLNEYTFMDTFEDNIIRQLPLEFKIIWKKNWKPNWKRYVKVL
ncbi:hypothetical protein LCGC14_0547640 [marine sediment metagenome]|uniref:Uncharacterized protein n=1 Tax=marine sediment metagenome TaxID=412755 RepID=A0A0F9S9D5_9ZZZZ